MKKIILLGIILLGFSNINAQNESAKWAFGGGISVIDFSGPQTKQYFQFKNFRGNQRFFIGKYLNPSFNLKADFTFGKIWFPEVSAYPEVIEGSLENRHLYDFGVNIEYKLNNGMILKEDAIVAPYLFTGFGVNSIIGYGAKNGEGSDINTFIPFGAGLNIRIVKWLSVNLQSAYKINIDNSFDYSQHSASLVFNFGGAPKGVEAKDIVEEKVDSDGDGVADLVDECPFAAGTEAMFGCPDTDLDGIGDSRDACPKLVGTLVNKGCPSKDSDEDGVPDDKDSCPDVKGERRYAGCPDNDGDGIVDKYDKCPNEKGVASNDGCPQVINTHTAEETNNGNLNTSNENSSGTRTNSNTSNTSNTTNLKANENEIIIYFNSSSSAIKSSERTKLNRLYSILKSNANYRILIKGYTDNKGNDLANVDLSAKRTRAIWKYLDKKGLNAANVDLYAYGEYEQNGTSDSKNRRVVIEIVK